MNPRGFSLLECLVVMAIVSVFLLMTQFLQQDVLADEKGQLIRSQLLRAIQAARTEAIFRHHEVVLCASDDGKGCGSIWRDRYIVLSGDQLIALFTLPKPHGVLHWRAFPRGRNDVLFQANGYTHFQNGTFWYCEKDGVKPRWAVMLSQSGVARVVHPDHDDEIRDSDGHSFECANL